MLPNEILMIHATHDLTGISYANTTLAISQSVLFKLFLLSPGLKKSLKKIPKAQYAALPKESSHLFPRMKFITSINLVLSMLPYH